MIFKNNISETISKQVITGNQLKILHKFFKVNTLLGNCLIFISIKLN